MHGVALVHLLLLKLAYRKLVLRDALLDLEPCF